MREINDKRVLEVAEKARAIRRHIVTMLCAAGSGHTGGSLSASDIVACLYFWEMNLDPANPDWEDRDRFVLSKGMQPRYCMQLWPSVDFSQGTVDDPEENGQSYKGIRIRESWPEWKLLPAHWARGSPGR